MSEEYQRPSCLRMLFEFVLTMAIVLALMFPVLDWWGSHWDAMHSGWKIGTPLPVKAMK